MFTSVGNKACTDHLQVYFKLLEVTKLYRCTWVQRFLSYLPENGGQIELDPSCLYMELLSLQRQGEATLYIGKLDPT